MASTELHNTPNQRRITVAFNEADVWFEYDPRRLNRVVIGLYLAMRKRGQTAPACTFLLGSGLTAWGLEQTLSPAAIRSLNDAARVAVTQTILNDFAAYQAVSAMDLRTAAPPVSA